MPRLAARAPRERAPLPWLPLALPLALLLACDPARPSPPPDVPSDRLNAPADPAPAAPVAPCRPRLLADPSAPPAGPAWVVVEGVGVLRIGDDAIRTDLVPAPDQRRWGSALLASDAGELWLSDWDGLHHLDPAGVARTIPAPHFDALVSQRGVLWAVTSDIEWELLRREGERWIPERTRRDFPGRYSDNKFVALAAADGALWVSSWNGLWRGAAGAWTPVEPPAPDAHMLDLWAGRERLIAADHRGAFLREGAAWRPLPWPRTGDIRRAVADSGLVAAPCRIGQPCGDLASPSEARIVLTSIEGGCVATSDPLPGSHVQHLALDAAGRAWVATDRGLALVATDGRLLGAWTHGALPGLTGAIVGLAVSGAGPRALPPARPVSAREVRARLTVYKNSAALSGAALVLCSALPERGACPPGALVRRATSDRDGRVLLRDVPDGEFWIDVQPPPGLDACHTPFTVTGGRLRPALDCPATGPCDLGDLTQCLPFEMPPPR